jgi:holo-[acyl-carrier protein] synthase
VIIGIGVDLIEIDRVKQAHKKQGSRFIQRLFTHSEAKYCLKKKDPYPSLAGRFAAKEAIIKAFSHGFGSSWKWTDIEVTRAANGRPSVRLRASVEKLRKQRKIKHIHLSIAHSKRDATAIVILEG